MTDVLRLKGACDPVETDLGICRGAEEQNGKEGVQQWASGTGSAFRAPFRSNKVGPSPRPAHIPCMQASNCATLTTLKHTQRRRLYPQSGFRP